MGISRSEFGKDFVFGAASSSYQIEGSATKGGRGPGIWDTFTQRYPAYVTDGCNGHMGVDSYNLYKEDVKVMKKMGLAAYRFSMSWPRILPGGTINAGVNREGIEYYNKLIDEIIANGIQPFATLFHWDLPQALEDKYGGFLNRQIVKDFCEFSELCFWEFGDRVKYWITMNEPTVFSMCGYVMGYFPPGRGLYSPEHFKHSNIPQIKHYHMRDAQIGDDVGDPGTEPYIVMHNLLLSHAEIVQTYKQKFKAQGGKIGFAVVTQWYEPLNNTEIDKEAAERALDFYFGWFMTPITKGCYPNRMIQRVGSRLPSFTDEEAAKLKGSFDFLGLNYYTSSYATEDPSPINGPPSYLSDLHVKTQSEATDGKTLIGPYTGTSKQCFYPEGLFKLLHRIKSQYGDPLIYITENGVAEPRNLRNTVSADLRDDARVEYLHGHLKSLKQAKDDFNANVQGYFIWSLLDDFEWSSGYSLRTGIIHVNYGDEYARYPKDSAIWYMNFLSDGKPKSSTNFAPKRALDPIEQESSKKKVFKR